MEIVDLGKDLISYVFLFLVAQACSNNMYTHTYRVLHKITHRNGPCLTEMQVGHVQMSQSLIFGECHFNPT